MYEAIKNFNKQFAFEPVVENSGRLKKFDKVVVLGMGGSHLAADLLKVWNPYLDIWVHSDYGLPEADKNVLRNSLIIASSYSGNTEEVLSGFEEARREELPLAALSIGGELLRRAKEDGIPFVKLPDTGIQPRSALGFSIRGVLALMQEQALLQETKALARLLEPEKFKERGKELAFGLKGHVPVIYTSRRNKAIGYNWKIKFNETGKIPAFANVLPELNHNEMTGFDVKEGSKELARPFYFLVLKDRDDLPKIQNRMEVLVALFKSRGLPVVELDIKGGGVFVKIFSSLIFADWVAYYIALQYGLEPEEVPMVEEFKKMIAE